MKHIQYRGNELKNLNISIIQGHILCFLHFHYFLHMLGGKDFVDLTESNSLSGDSSKSDLIIDEDRASMTSNQGNSTIVGVRRGRGRASKYAMKLIAEERFCSMIWDVSISPEGDVYVSSGEGLFKCNTELDRLAKLDKIVLPGGVGFLSDGQLVALCRSSDTISFFSQDGVFIRSFSAGSCPMSLVVGQHDEIVVSDVGQKCVHFFDKNGKELSRLPTAGKCYSLQWPLYLSDLGNDLFAVCDCHGQKVHKFNRNGKHMSTYKLKTQAGNMVLRPHGISTSQEHDLLVIDTSMNTVELFSKEDKFQQTVINHDDGNILKPKCLAVSKDSRYLVIGGRLGTVRVYELLDSEGSVTPPVTPVKMEVVKQEVKSEATSSCSTEDIIVLE